MLRDFLVSAEMLAQRLESAFSKKPFDPRATLKGLQLKLFAISNALWRGR